MTSVISIVFTVVLLLTISIGYGLAFNRQTLSGQILFGFSFLLCFLFAVDAIFITVCAPKKLIFLMYSVICLFGVIQFLKRFDEIKIENKKLWIIMIPFCIVMVLIFMNRTMALETFDSMHYLSVVNEGIGTEYFGFIDYETGAITDFISITDDYESFYHLNSFILWGLAHVYEFLNSSQVFTIQIYVWSMSFLFFVLLFCFFVDLTNRFQFSSKHKLISGIFILLFVAGHYWNNSLTFLGNTYRQFYSAIIALELYTMFRKKTFSMEECFSLSILTGALIAFSSSAFLLNFIVLFCLLVVLLNHSIESYGKKVIILTVPTVMYGMVYFLNMKKMSWIYCLCIVLFYLFCFAYDHCLKKWHNRIAWLIHMGLAFSWIVIVSLSLKCIIFDNYPLLEFFFNYSSYDMIWDFFSFNDFRHIVINTPILIGAFLSFKQVKSDLYMKYLLLLILFFVNPVSMTFVKVYLAGILSQRIFETVFNYYNCIIFLFVFFEVFKNKFGNGDNILLTALCVVSLTYLFSYYHDSFRPEEDFHPLYKMQRDEVEILSTLNEYVKSSSRRYRIVSQSDATKGYISNIKMMHEFRGYDKYTLNEESSMIVKLFLPRDYPGQVMFTDEPDFHCMCDTLIKNRVDFVLIDKNQVFLDKEVVLPIEFLVRDCAELLFENETYAIYRFYWDE